MLFSVGRVKKLPTKPHNHQQKLKGDNLNGTDTLTFIRLPINSNFVLHKTIDLSFSIVPDNIILDIMRERLAQLDCVSRGWVLHGYPRTREQAEALAKDGFVPNR